MRKSIKLIYLASTLLFIIAICFGIITKKSFKETKIDLESAQMNNAYVSMNEESFVDYFENNIEDLSELISASDLIIIGNADGERQSYRGAVKTKIKVNTIIENKSLVADLPNEIFIYEPNNFHFDTYMSMEGYNLMQNNKDYILFLRHIEAPMGYNYKNDEIITFIPTSTYYGKYEMENDEFPEAILLKREIMYKDVKDQAILTEKQEIINKYNEIRNDIFSFILQTTKIAK